MKEVEYYPNACSVCYRTTNLKRCSRCQMISYCCSEHQIKHWSEHKLICKVISFMMKKRGVSHLFEKLKGADFDTWKKERMLMLMEAKEMIFYRELELSEEFLFKFPRSCFVCRESRQKLLTACSGCPAATFCQEHPSSTIHDEDCAKMKETFELQKRNDNDPHVTHKGVFSVLNEKKICESSKLPSSMREFISNFPTSITSEDLKLHLTDLFSIVLTLFASLKKLEFSPNSKLTIHAHSEISCVHPWELFLHLFPNVQVLKIVLIKFSYSMSEPPPQSLICKECRKKKKRIDVVYVEYYQYIGDSMFSYDEEPDALIYCDLAVPEQLKFFKMLSSLNCPLILTTSNEAAHNILKKAVQSIVENPKLVIFEGLNKFKALVNYREDDRLSCSNNYVIILKSRQDLEVDKLSDGKISTEVTRNFFTAGVCQVCGSSEDVVTCKRCKMIFYCGESHQDENKNQHEDLCRSVFEVLSENEALNLVDKSKIDDSNSWVKNKVRLMSKVKLKLGRELLDFEKQMFLFPKTCFVCHESDSSLLKSCQCGVYLCKIHKSDPEHKNLCNNFSLALKIGNTEQPKIPKAAVKIINLAGNCDAYISMENFIDSFLSFEKKISDFEIPKLEKLLISDFLTRPFTFLWCLEKLNFKNESLIVHVIGATNSEVLAHEYWKLVLLHYHQLKSLKIIFIGPEISKSSSIENGLEFPASLIFERTLQVESYTLKYEEYFQCESFIEPNFIIGFNLNFHESKLGTVDCDWKEMILTLRKIDVPFILTAASEIRARKDHEIFCDLSGRIMDCFCYEKNPFAGLTPGRDFETERLVFSNQYVIIYNELCEEKLSKLNISEKNFKSVVVSEPKNVKEVSTKSKNDSNHQNDKKTEQKKK